MKIICVGKIKEEYFKNAIKEYQTRLSKYTKLEIVELNDYSLTPSLNKQKEGEEILKNIKDKDYVITLEITGRKYNSIELAKKIEKIQIINSNIVFVIGGSDGLSEDVKKRSNEKISFSDLTFPHQLFRVMLLEQMYRSYKILNNESYHK